MGRFILRYTAAPGAPGEHLEKIRAIPSLEVIDESPRMLLVEADEGALREGIKDFPDWSVHSEQQYPLPDTRKKIG